MKTYRPHFFMMFKTFYKLLYILLFPLIRILFSFKDIRAWFQVLTIEIILICIILVISFFKWFLSYYYIDNNTFFFVHGILFKKCDCFPKKNIAAVNIYKNPLLILFNASYIQLDTIGGITNSFDCKILVYKENLLDIKDFLSFNSKDEFKHNIPIYKSKFHNILLLAFSSSNFAFGFLLAYAFLSKTSKLTGEYLTKPFFDTLNEFSQKALFGIPPVISFLGYLFLIGWGVSFVNILFKHGRFLLYKKNNNLHIIRGVLSRYNYVIKEKHINAIRIRQTLFMKILGICSIYVQCAGFGKQKGELSVIAPCIEEYALEDYAKKVFPKISQKNPKLCPDKKTHIRFLFSPVFFGLISFTFGVIGNNFLSILLNTETTIILWLSFFIIVLCIWWLMIRQLAYKYSGISVDNDEIILNREKTLGIESILIPQKKIQKIIISQSFFQKFNNICNITITTLASGKEKYTVKNLDFEKSKNLFNIK